VTQSHTIPFTEPLKEEEPSLRSGEPAQAPVADEPEPPDIRKELWTEGPPIVTRLAGLLNGQARAMVGRFLKGAGGDCQIVLAALRSADEERPYNAIEWVQGAIRARKGGGTIDQIKRDWNLPSFNVPDFIDEPERIGS